MKPAMMFFVFLALLMQSSNVVAGSTLGARLAVPNGVDRLRGAWGGEMILTGETGRQINFFLDATMAEPGIRDGLRASGFFSHDPVGGQKRSKAPHLPMMAQVLVHADGTFSVVMLATFPLPPELGGWTTILKLTGQGSFGRAAVTDDEMAGTWYLRRPDGGLATGPWAVRHLDRRNVNAPTVDLTDPTLNFGADVYANLEGPVPPPEMRGQGTILGAGGNIVMDRVRVTAPDGRSMTLPRYTDVFSPEVDWTTLFRFTTWQPGLPVAGGRYVFQALDVLGNPILGVAANDVWVGVTPPDPPSRVTAQLSDAGLHVDWIPVADVPDSFEPTAGLGFYQLELSGPQGMVFGASGIHAPPHLIPAAAADLFPGQDWGLALSGLADGTYWLRTCVHSLAPAGSAGHGFEYNNADPSQQIVLQILGGRVTIQN